MKPLHEEHLTCAVAYPDGQMAIVAADGTMVAVTRAVDGAVIARRLAAGPGLARALLAVAEEGADTSVDGKPCWCTKTGRDSLRAKKTRVHESHCERAREALRDAGAIP